jgi:hypothetical protein
LELSSSTKISRSFPEKEFFTFNNPSVDSVLMEIDKYVESFAKYGIVVFKDAYYSEHDVIRILTKMGSKLGWTPNQPGSDYEKGTATPSSEHSTWKHTVRHAERISEAIGSNRNLASTQIIQWHLDGVAAEFQHLAAGWNMQVFTCDPSCGSSGFLDMEAFLDAVPDKYLSLLEKSKIAHLPIMHNPSVAMESTKTQFMSLLLEMNDPTWIFDVADYISSYPREAIGVHPYTKNPVLRTDPVRAPWGVQEFLFSVDGRKPTNDELALFNEYISWLERAIDRMSNEVTYWHHWGPGDFVVPDLFRMLHGVRGGFQDGERIFNAYWCFPHGTPADNELRISISEYENIAKSSVNE